MALVVESTSSASASNATDVTVTKPSGVEVGDLLLILSGDTDNFTDNLPTSTGFTRIANKSQGVSDGATVVILSRIADSSDVSASNYTVDYPGGTTSAGIAGMMRVSGWNTGDPLYASASDGGLEDSASINTGASSLTITPPNQQLLLLITSFNSYSGTKSSATFDGYTVTSADSNPSWTEVFDTQVSLFSNANNFAMSAAYAIRTDTSTITAYDLDISTDTSGDADYFASLLAVIVAPLDQTGTNALLEVSPTTFSNTAVEVGTAGTNALLEVSPTIPTQSGSATSPSSWTDESRGSTTWVDEPKL